LPSCKTSILIPAPSACSSYLEQYSTSSGLPIQIRPRVSRLCIGICESDTSLKLVGSLPENFDSVKEWIRIFRPPFALLP
jgi:hypothetical protein